MPGKIFVNYRRDDDPNGAARVRDGLAAKFGASSIFMDVDNLLAGQRFDKELEKALAQCDVLISVMGTRWIELMAARAASGERDYVREEIAAALARQITVIPVRIGREGHLAPLPRRQDLPEDIQDLLHYQKHDVTHERFGRDIAELNAAIVAARRAIRPERRVSRGWIAVGALSVALAGYAGAYYSGVPVPWMAARIEPLKEVNPPVAKTDAGKERATEAERARQVAAKLIEDRKRAEQEKAKAEEVERQRLATLKAEEEARRRDPVAALVPGSGKSAKDCPECPEMVVVPAGSFTMGSSPKEIAALTKEDAHLADAYKAEGPQRTVTIRQPFAVGKFEVTFAEWEACVAGGGCTGNRSPSDHGWGKGRQPVINVSWDDAKQYVDWLSRKSGKTYRLLSEAEWEYAARARGTGRWTFGDDEQRLQEFGWYSDNSNARTHPVGGRKPNDFGLHDMHGNVFEWVEDCWHNNYSNAHVDGRIWIDACQNRNSFIARGGAFIFESSLHRSAFRLKLPHTDRFLYLGFRVARTLGP